MIFEKKTLFNIKFVSSFSTNLSETFFILSVIERDMIEIVYWSAYKVHIKYPLLLSDSNETWIFSENIKFSNCMNIRPLGAELFHADRRTDRHDEANSNFSQFCEGA